MLRLCRCAKGSLIVWCWPGLCTPALLTLCGATLGETAAITPLDQTLLKGRVCEPCRGRGTVVLLTADVSSEQYAPVVTPP